MQDPVQPINITYYQVFVIFLPNAFHAAGYFLIGYTTTNKNCEKLAAKLVAEFFLALLSVRQII